MISYTQNTGIKPWEKMNKDIGEAVQKFRIENNMSQSDLANKLGISQAHVSRIEKGLVELPEHLYSRLRKIIRIPTVSHSFDLQIEQDSYWNIAYFYYPKRVCGDRVHIDTRAGSDKNWILHCDAAGSDIAAAKDSDLLVVSFEAIINTFTIGGLSPETVYGGLNKVFRQTKNLWRGEPSANIIAIGKGHEKVEYICGGMPAPVLFKANVNKANKITNKSHYPPIGQATGRQHSTAQTSYMDSDDVLFFASDGFEEIFKTSISIDFETFFGKIARIQHGDVEGAGQKILNTLNESTKNKRINDDLSFVLIAKK